MPHDKTRDVSLPPLPRGWTRDQDQTLRKGTEGRTSPIPAHKVGSRQGENLAVRMERGHPPHTHGAPLHPAPMPVPAPGPATLGGDCVESETDVGGVLGLCPPRITDTPGCATVTDNKIPKPPTCATATQPQPPPATGKKHAVSVATSGEFKTTVQPCVDVVAGPNGGTMPVPTLPGEGGPSVEPASNVISIRDRVWRRVIQPTSTNLPLSAIPPLPDGFKPAHYPHPGDKLSPDRIAEAIVLCGGWLSKVAASLGISYKNVWEYSNKYPELKELIAEVKERNLDDCEDALMRRVRSGDTEAIKFWLRCQGKTRGWVERTEHAGVPDHPLTFIVKPASADEPKTVPALPEGDHDTDPDRVLQ